MRPRGGGLRLRDATAPPCAPALALSCARHHVHLAGGGGRGGAAPARQQRPRGEISWGGSQQRRPAHLAAARQSTHRARTPARHTRPPSRPSGGSSAARTLAAPAAAAAACSSDGATAWLRRHQQRASGCRAIDRAQAARLLCPPALHHACKRVIQVQLRCNAASERQYAACPAAACARLGGSGSSLLLCRRRVPVRLAVTSVGWPLFSF